MKFNLTKKNKRFFLLCLFIILIFLSLYYFMSGNRENFILYLHKDPSFIDDSNLNNTILDNKDPICSSSINDRESTAICYNKINIDKFIFDEDLTEGTDLTEEKKLTENKELTELKLNQGFKKYCNDGNNEALTGNLFNECPNECYKVAKTIKKLNPVMFENLKKIHKNLNKYIDNCL